MARDTDHLTGGFETENTGGFLSGLLAEEDHFDRRTLLRLGAWAVVSIGAVTVAVMSNQSSLGSRRDQIAAADLARQSQQIQSVAKDSQNEARRLASAIETLNGDRDRLYARVTMLEQGLDSATGAIVRQHPAAATPQSANPSVTAEPPLAAQNPPPAPAAAVTAAPSPTAAAAAASASTPTAAPVPAPVATPPATPPEKPVAETAREQSTATAPSAPQAASNPPVPTPATPLVASKSIMAPPDAAAGKLIRSEPPAGPITSAPMPEMVASVSNDEAESEAVTAPSGVAAQRTEFGVDVGTANSVNGLRALWRGLLKSNSALAELRPVIAIREGRNGLGMQLRLIAGPLSDAATAARICAALTESKRACETAVFDGQRLAMKADEAPVVVKPTLRRRGSVKRGIIEEPPKKPESPSTMSLLFKRERTQ